MTEDQKQAIDDLAKAFGWDALSDYAFEHEMDKNATLFTRGDESIKTRVGILRSIIEDITE